MKTIIKRELFSYFATMTGWVFIGLFAFMSAVYFVIINVFGLSPYYSATLQNMTLLYMIFIPALTMRFFSGEVRQSTDRLLFTSPVNVLQIVLGKFLAGLLLFLAALAVTVIFPVILSFFGPLPVAQIAGTFIGFAFVGCSFISVGLFVSSLSGSQLISAIAAFCSLLVLFLIDVIAGVLPYFIFCDMYNALPAKSLGWLSIMSRFDNFAKGILNISDIVYYITFSTGFIILTVLVIEARKGKGGAV